MTGGPQVLHELSDAVDGKRIDEYAGVMYFDAQRTLLSPLACGFLHQVEEFAHDNEPKGPQIINDLQRNLALLGPLSRVFEFVSERFKTVDHLESFDDETGLIGYFKHRTSGL